MPIDKTLLADIRNNNFTHSKLSLMDEGFEDDDVMLLVEALQSNAHIRELDLSINAISDKAAVILSSMTSLEVLNVSSNNIGPQGAAALAKSKLRSLDISANPIGDAVASFALATSLVELIAAECDITDAGARELFLSPSLKKLDLSSNKLKGACLKNVSQSVALEDLCLLQNDLSPESLDYLSSERSLVRLNLSSAMIGDRGAELLANKSIKELILMQCFIGDKGAAALAKNGTIRKLVLFNNHIKDDGVKALSTNKTIMYLNLQGNRCDTDILKNYYQTKNGAVFERDEAFIAGLKKNYEQNSVVPGFVSFTTRSDELRTAEQLPSSANESITASKKLKLEPSPTPGISVNGKLPDNRIA